MPIMTDSELLARLRSADPALGQELDRARVARVLVEATATSRSRRRPGWRVWFGAIIVAALGVAGLTPAVATGVHHFLSETGWFGDPNPPQTSIAPDSAGPSTEQDSSEYIDTGRSDFVAYAVSVFPSYITLPRGYTTAQFATSVATAIRPPARGFMQKTGIVDDFETYARCTWMSEWMSADDAHSPSRLAAAAAVLTNSATWPATVSTDGGGIVAGFETVAHAAAAGNRGPVAHEYTLNCPTMSAEAAK
jgi:hypothetical protein